MPFHPWLRSIFGNVLHCLGCLLQADILSFEFQSHFIHFQIVKSYQASEITGPNYTRPPLKFYNTSFFPAPSQPRVTGGGQQSILPWSPEKGEIYPAPHSKQEQSMDSQLVPHSLQAHRILTTQSSSGSSTSKPTQPKHDPPEPPGSREGS